MNMGKEIGVGNTATVYEWGTDKRKVLKLFRAGYPEGDAEFEYRNALALNALDLPKPQAYELVRYEGRTGIIYDRVEGEPLDGWVMQTQDLAGCAGHMANLHRAVLRHTVHDVSDYKSFLGHHLRNMPPGHEAEQAAALNLLAGLADGDTLCHGDFHPGNILIADGRTMLIDFMNICRGTALYDVARTVFLVQYTPVPAGVPDSERDSFRQLKKTLTDAYLAEMEITREQIADYLTVIRAARLGECPDEPVSGE